MIGRLIGMRGRSFTVPGVLLVAIAAALWGLDPILRKPLAKNDGSDDDHLRRARPPRASHAAVPLAALRAMWQWSQWLGVALIITVVSLLPLQRRRRMVRLPAPAPRPA